MNTTVRMSQAGDQSLNNFLGAAQVPGTYQGEFVQEVMRIARAIASRNEAPMGLNVGQIIPRTHVEVKVPGSPTNWWINITLQVLAYQGPPGNNSTATVSITNIS